MDTNQTYSAQVAGEVRAQLARAGKDAGDLASMLGVSRPTASSRWNGAKPYTLDELFVIAEALSLPVDALVLPGKVASLAA